ncbi:hypothetical protein W97_01415 [Coniosporium apollinis CBS 100218]|uniref:Uncharacterized protein n=1 Tax=Coniosporium apollinis (strain CBS 100218) TaxID=1168221 RepID=R7YJX2_CONA1|nr:uncharacterized protein W97_01415 [Coniosporium apollinis CBS 100218]EON62195.1 hypothetical protein W97_01415 [Coniosporium apollinis CBS 100218]
MTEPTKARSPERMEQEAAQPSANKWIAGVATRYMAGYMEEIEKRIELEKRVCKLEKRVKRIKELKEEIEGLKEAIEERKMLLKQEEEKGLDILFGEGGGGRIGHLGC